MSQRLERLFDYYAGDLRRFAPKFANHFGCPLCHRALEKVSALEDVVAEEHIVPEQLGSRMITVTCRQCNSQDGGKLDAHLIQRVLLEARKRPAKIRMKVGRATMGGEMILPADSRAPIHFRGVRKQSDPRQVEQIKRLIESKKKIGLKANLGYNENRSLVALVRSAYLLMFRTFGYRYVLDRSGLAVRKQIQNPVERTPVLNGIMWRVPDSVPSGHTLAIMREPEGIRSFVAILRLDDDTRHVAAVTLPAPGTDGSELDPQLILPEAQGEKTVQPIPIPKRGFMPFVEAWNYVVGRDAN